METIKESIEFNVPVSAAYNQWTQFEEFPKFMEGVEAVEQIDATRLRWVAEVNGERREWRAEVIEQTPNQRIVWIVTFEPLGEERTLVTVEMSYEPEGLKETLGAKIGLDSRQVREDLQRFKELVEALGTETGAWPGEVHAGERRT